MVNILKLYAITSLLMLGACTTADDATDSADSIWSKDQHQLAEICISAKHDEDVAAFRSYLSHAGFKRIGACSDEVESDAVMTITRKKYADQTFDILVRIDRTEDVDTENVYEAHTPGKFNPGESAEQSVRKALKRDRATYELRLSELREKFTW